MATVTQNTMLLHVCNFNTSPLLKLEDTYYINILCFGYNVSLASIQQFKLGIASRFPKSPSYFVQ